VNVYRPTLRPASFCTLPQGVKWDYVEVPLSISGRPDLPISVHRYGVIKTDRALTKDEMQHFDLVEVAAEGLSR
jgi:hypothetical protein